MSKNISTNKLKQFYETAQGKLVFYYLNKLIKPCVASELAPKVLVIGYGQPYAELFEHMQVKMIEDCLQLPTEDNSIDRVCLMHTLELEENILWPQIWRILKPNGKLLLIAANKFSLFKALNNVKSFGVFSLRHMLIENLFEVQKITSTPLMPPIMHKIMPGELANKIENINAKYLKFAGMFWVIEAQKSLGITENLFNYQGFVEKLAR